MLIIGTSDVSTAFPDTSKQFTVGAYDEATGGVLGQFTLTMDELGLPGTFTNRCVVHPTQAVVYLFASGSKLIAFNLNTGVPTVYDLTSFFSPTPTSVTVRAGERSPVVSADGSYLVIGVATVGGTPAGWPTNEGVLRLALNSNGAVTGSASLHVGSSSIVTATQHAMAVSADGRYVGVGIYYSAGTGDRRYYNAVLDFDTLTVPVSRYASEAATNSAPWGVAFADNASSALFAGELSSSKGVFTTVPGGTATLLTSAAMQSKARIAHFEPGSTTRALRIQAEESDGVFARVYSVDTASPAASNLVAECPSRALSTYAGFIGAGAVWGGVGDVVVARGVWNGASLYQVEVSRRTPTGSVVTSGTQVVAGFSTGFSQTLRVIKSLHSDKAAVTFSVSPGATYDMYAVLVDTASLSTSVVLPPIPTVFTGGAGVGFTSGELAPPEFWTRVEGAFA